MVSNISTISLCQSVRADTCSGGSPAAATPRLPLQPGGRRIKHGIKMFPPKSEIRKEDSDSPQISLFRKSLTGGYCQAPGPGIA